MREPACVCARERIKSSHTPPIFAAYRYYAFQIFFLIIYRQTTWCKDKLHLYLLDYCWVTNYLLGIFSIFQLATFLAPFQLAPSEKRTEILQQIFFVWYTTASGPLSGGMHPGPANTPLRHRMVPRPFTKRVCSGARPMSMR